MAFHPSHKMIQDTKKTKEMTDEQCPKEVKTQPYDLFLQSKWSDEGAQAEKALNTSS